jgi:trehalose 6-phosphate synthase
MARLVLVSNRLPVTVSKDSSGNPVVERSSGGLVSALGQFMMLAMACGLAIPVAS